MKYLILFSAVFFSIISCSIVNKNTNIDAYTLSWQADFLDSISGNSIPISGKHNLFFNAKNMILERKIGFTDNQNKKSERSEFYYFKLNDKNCLKILELESGSIDFKNIKLCNADSIKKEFLFYRSGIIEFILPQYNLLQKNILKEGNNITKKYSIVNKVNATYADTILFRFNSNLTNIPFSFSEQFDKENNSKLISIEMIFNENFHSKYEALTKRRISIIKLSKFNFTKENHRIMEIFKNL